MDEETEITPEQSHSVDEQIQQIVKQNPGLYKHAENLETVLTTLATLPFKDEIQQATLLEHVQRLQGNHIIQIFNCGVSPLQKSMAESPAEFLEEVRKLFEICFSFCYTTDVSKRVSFECYVKALAFCFPSEPNQCLSTVVVSKLLELVQIIQEGKLVAHFGLLEINGANYFFGELLQIFESRRHEGYLVEIIDQTVRLASVDAEHVIKDISLQSEHMIFPLFVITWMKLLKLTHVSNGFAFALAKVDSPIASCIADQRVLAEMMPFMFGAARSQTINLSWSATVCYFVSVLEEMKRNGIEVSLPHDKERLDIFFNHLNHFRDHPNVTATSLKLLAATRISNEVLREVFDQFLCKEKVVNDFRKEAFELVFQFVSVHPDGELVKKVLKFWKEVISDDPGYQTLTCLLGLFVEGSSNQTICLQEKAERIMDFLEEIPRQLRIPLIDFWQLLWWFIKIFPTTFNQKLQDILALINREAEAAQVPVEQRQACVIGGQVPTTLQFLQWVYQQSCPEEMKSEMIKLLMCSSGEGENPNWIFGIDNVIKTLGLCPRLPFNTKKDIVRQLTYLAPFFKEREITVLKNFVENIASNQTLKCMEEILCEFLDFMECIGDEQRPKTIPEDVVILLSLLSKVSISGERRKKLMQLSKKSEEGLQSGLRILQLIEKHCCVLQERTNEYFDLLFAAIVETLKEDSDLCEQLCNQHPCNFPSTDVLKVWTFAVTGLLSLGLFKEEIDSRCCCPVLQQAYGFSPFETLQLLSQVRSTAVRLAHLPRRQIEASLSSYALNTSQESSIGETDLLEKFVASLTIILSTPALSSWEKLMLVRKVCGVVISTPHILTTATLRNALINYIPWEQSISSNNEGIHWEFYRIVDMLDNLKVLHQLSRIPALDGMPWNNSLCSVLSTKMSDSSSSVNVVDIFLFIGSLQDLDQAFFDQLLPFLKVVIQESTLMEDVLEHLKELVYVLRNIRSEMIPLTMLNFASFIENPVNKQERDRFLNEVAMRWTLPSRRVLSFLEVPRLLWKAYNTASTPAKRLKSIDRVQEILKKSKKVEDWVNFESSELPEDYITRRIACCELEWLVVHSSLSTEDAALALDLSCLSFQPPHPRLRCLTFSDVQIEDGIFKFAVPREKETASDIGSTFSVAVTSAENVSPATESPHKPILTPVLMAQKVIHHLKRVLKLEEDPTEKAFSLWNLIFHPRKPLGCEAECALNCSFLDDYVDVFLSILAEASSVEMMFHWETLDQHHVCQCSDVILKACKWNGRNEDDIGEKAFLNLQTAVSTTLEQIRKNTCRASFVPLLPLIAVPCFRLLDPQLKHLGNMLENRLPIEVTTRVLDLYQIDIQAGIAVGEIVSLWSCKQEALALVEKIQSFCEGDEGSSLKLDPARSDFVWKLLKAFGLFCVDSCKDLLARFKELNVLYDPEDERGFSRLPQWRETMIADGFPARVIDSWCTAFLMTPLEVLTSRDVDAIVDLDSRSLQIVTSASQIIKRVIFPEVKEEDEEGVKESQIKERIRLARLLNEFIKILKLRKPEENPKDAVVRDIVVDACDELCKSHENENRRTKDLYKIHGQKLKALFKEIFGKRRMSEDGQVSIQDCGMTHRAGEEEPRMAAFVARQTSYLHENLPSVLNHKGVYEPMLVLLRRWLSGIVTKPTLASRTLEIVQLLFSDPPSNALLDVDKLHGIIQTRILSLERNQSVMAQLQASGYNQRGQDTPDLWSSRTVELPGYLSKRESPNSRLFTKKLVQVLRPLWNEWKNILLVVHKESIKVGDAEVCTKDLFDVQSSLEEMEKQVAAVKEVVKQVNSGDMDGRVKHLIRLEQRHRARIEKLYKSNKSQPEACGREKDELKKFVAVWENRFLEQVKMCSERIPGCYAPNGFHSEKPVLCALSVDNRILTVFKEEKGRREEIENVEVKLFEAGMYVYGLHTSGHDYVTDELWAAFYKMLLEKRLVPSIVLSNESPGFDWIKQFVQPATSHPCPLRWELHNGIVPREEDYFDYTPISAALLPDLHGLKEFLTLTRENVSSFQFSDLKEVNIAQEKEKQTQEMTGKVIQQLQRELHVLHGENETIKKDLAGKLAFAVRKTVKSIVDEVQPTEESVKELIDMERLAFGHPEVERTEARREQYAASVLRACEHAWSILP